MHNLSQQSFDFIHVIENVALGILIIILSTYHVLHICYQLFHWPPFMVKLHERQREQELRHVLEKLGIDEDVKHELRSTNTKSRIKKTIVCNDPKEQCARLLKDCMDKGPHQVGVSPAKTFPVYFDVMSDSLNPHLCNEYALILTSYLHEYFKNNMPVFDRVVGIKKGSPLIAYVFAEKIVKPCSIHRGKGNYKYNSAIQDVHSLFDGHIVSNEHILIVDDSTTSGNMVLECVEALRAAGCHVSHCLVLFEPLGANAREKLIKNGVNLHSVLVLDPPTMDKIKSLR
jgi:orotate phosphoribosyltransferase